MDAPFKIEFYSRQVFSKSSSTTQDEVLSKFSPVKRLTWRTDNNRVTKQAGSLVSFKLKQLRDKVEYEPNQYK